MSAIVPHRENNFDAIRLFAAATVVVSHGWSLSGREGGPLIGGRPAFDVAVWVFFCLSGYLVAASWTRSSRIAGFLIRRAARIVPGLVVVVLVTVFAIGPALTTASLPEYFSSPVTWRYLLNLTLIATYDLPGVFLDAPRPGVVNGVFWSLGPEFSCYLVVVLVGFVLARLRSRRRLRDAVTFLLVGVVLVTVTIAFPARLGGFEPATEAAVFFMVGAALAQLPAVIRLPLPPAVVGVVAWVVVGLVNEPIATAIAWLVLPYAVLSIGARSTPFVRRAGRFGDASYGTYLWGFLIQQIIITTTPDLPLAVLNAVSLFVSVALGFASWHLVEKPVLTRAQRWSASSRAARRVRGRKEVRHT